MSTTVTINRTDIDAGDITAATGLACSTEISGGQMVVTFAADLTPQELATARAQVIAAVAPDPRTRPGNILTVAQQQAAALNGTDVTALTAAQTRTLVTLLAARNGWVKWDGAKYVLDIH